MVISGDYIHRTAEIHILEVYVPKRLRYLGQLYTFLWNQLHSSGRKALLQGYSIYEVDGAFVSHISSQEVQVYDEKTLVVRLVYELPGGDLETRIHDIARKIIEIAESREEEIWIIRYQATQFRFIREG